MYQCVPMQRDGVRASDVQALCAWGAFWYFYFAPGRAAD